MRKCFLGLVLVVLFFRASAENFPIGFDYLEWDLPRTTNFVVIYGDSSNNYNTTNFIGITNRFTLNISTPKYVRVYALGIGEVSELSNELYTHPYLETGVSRTNETNYLSVSVQPIKGQILQIQKSLDLTTWTFYTTSNVFSEPMVLEKCFYRISYLNN